MHAHWNDPSKVVIENGDTSVTLNAKELIAAIDNATNTAK